LSTVNKNYITLPTEKNLDFWVEKEQNVLFIGHAGVGKTSMIVETFKRNNLNYRYFSASTMDPWVDFIGVPKEMSDANGPYLDLVKPKEFRDDEIQAIFFDEFNRSHKKVRNAVMELIQFKSINGRKFPNLKIIWAAINPDDADNEDTTYDVEPLDDAQRDRFHIQIELPYKPCEKYFKHTFGEDDSNVAIEWWNGLDRKTQLRVSPRRLETVLRLHKMGGNIRHALPPDANVAKLENLLKNGSPTKKLEELLALNIKADIKAWLEDENNFSCIKETLVSDNELLKKCLPLIGDEKITNLMSTQKKVSKFVFDNAKEYEALLGNIANSTTNKKLAKNATKALTNAGLITVAPKSTMRTPNYFLANAKVNAAFLQIKKSPTPYPLIPNVINNMAIYCNAAKRKANINLLYGSLSYHGAGSTECKAILTNIENYYSWSQASTIAKINSSGGIEVINYAVNVANITIQDLYSKYPRIFNEMMNVSGTKAADNWIYKV